MRAGDEDEGGRKDDDDDDDAAAAAVEGNLLCWFGDSPSMSLLLAFWLLLTLRCRGGVACSSVALPVPFPNDDLDDDAGIFARDGDDAADARPFAAAPLLVIAFAFAVGGDGDGPSFAATMSVEYQIHAKR